MNWRRSTAEIARWLEHAPFLYLSEWTERLDRCISQIHAAETRDLGSPDQVKLTTDALRSSAQWLLKVAEELDAAAARRARIAALRDTKGRDPVEAELFRAKADALQRAEQQRQR